MYIRIIPSNKPNGRLQSPFTLTVQYYDTRGNFLQVNKILSRASEVESPTNHLGSRQRRDTGQGSSSLDTANLMISYQKLKKKPSDDWIRFTKAG